MNRSTLTRELRLLGNRMMRLAGTVAQLQSPVEDALYYRSFERDSELWLVAAQEMYRERAERSRFFPNDLFGEPLWDILLDLYIAEKQGRRVSVTSACLASHAAPTTALRHLHRLEEQGLVTREHDSSDKRRFHVRISDKGYAQMTAYIAEQRKNWLAEDLMQSAPHRSFAAAG